MKRLIAFAVVLLVLELGAMVVLLYSEGLRKAEYESAKELVFRNNLDANIAAYEQVFKTVLENRIDTNEVKSLIRGALHDPAHRSTYRNRLYVEMEPIFNSLQSVGLTHMHFHFKDSSSFLRVHQPDFFGDDISAFRKLVVTANEKNVFTKGFENGRHLLAYRYVFPLNMNGEHLGSVELSVGMDQLIQKMNRVYGIGYSYLLEKTKIFREFTTERINDYLEHSISDRYLMASCDACATSGDDGCDLENIREELLHTIKLNSDSRLGEYKEFVEIADHIDGDILFVFMPVKDMYGRGLGYIIGHGYVDDYQVISDTYTVVMIAVWLIIFTVVVLIYLLDTSRIRASEYSLVLEEKVKEKVKELQDKELFYSQQSKMATMGEMMASVLHQWKQPINTISMISDLLLFDQDKEGDSEAVANLKLIKDQTLFMSQTGSDFMNFMKPSKEKTAFNVAEAVEDVIRLFGFSFDKYGVEFEREYAPDVYDSANTVGFPNEFKHVVLNLFNNSRDAIVDLREKKIDAGEDASSLKGVISIKMYVNEDQVVMVISDTGGGIPANIIGSVFDKYFSTKGQQGYGIGLYMCKDMVELSMSGSISVKNIMGGAEFTLCFPLADL